MKKVLTLVLILVVSGAGLFAQEPMVIKEEPFVPMNPEVMAQGGSFTGEAHGFNSLFYNPAGYAVEPGALTIGSVNAWAYVNPARLSVLTELAAEEIGAEAQKILNEQITSGGFGVGGAVGVAATGRKLGIGLLTMADSYVYGKNLLGVEGDASVTLGAILGYAYPLDLGILKLTLGANAKYLLRAHLPLTNNVALNLLGSLFDGSADPVSLLNNVNTVYGNAIGFDIGALVELGGLSVGLSMRDVGGTKFNYQETPFGVFLESIRTSSKFPEQGTPIPENVIYEIPMLISAGVAFHPDLGFMKYILDPSVHADLQDPLGVIEGRSPWTLLHMGGELRILSLVSIRGGFNQGYLTAGVGVKLWFLDVNAAVFTRELGKRLGDKPNSGLTVEGALRF